MEQKKREHGRYYTQRNPFGLGPFRRWARAIGIRERTVLEPFAGRNNLIRMLQDTGQCGRFASYDIEPADGAVKRRDTLDSFPGGYDVCISNPPWLGLYSARRRRIRYPDIGFDDLYKHCLGLALENCRYVGFIVPATFLQSGLFRDRLSDVVFLNSRAFDDTENPVCLALFGDASRDVRVYNDERLVGTLGELEAFIPPLDRGVRMRFNDKSGTLGLVGIDSTAGPSIRFCRGEEISCEIKHSSRSITRIGGIDRPDIDGLNEQLRLFRKRTCDVFLTPFKGLRKDGMYRRRISYSMARRFVAAYAPAGAGRAGGLEGYM